MGRRWEEGEGKDGEEERGAGRKKRERGILKKAQAYWVLGTERGR